MKIKCINTGNTKNITINKEYEVVKQTDEHYYILNNAQEEFRYSKQLFEKLLEQEQFDSNNISFNYNYILYNGKNIMNLNDTNPLDKFAIKDTDISCGINQVVGVNSFMSLLHELILNLINELNNINVININKKDLANTVFQLLFNHYFNEDYHDVRFLLLSTNISNNSFIDDLSNEFNFNIIEKLKSLSDFSIEGENDNSGNDIILWVFKL